MLAYDNINNSFERKTLQSPSIVILVPYFGSWPEWFDLYLLSCRYNPGIDWLFYTDCERPEDSPANVRFVKVGFDQYKQMVSERLGIQFNPKSAYKLCDLKPALGSIHQPDIYPYDFYGFGDIDIIHGQIRQFITDNMLKKYDVIGTHNRRLSGHFSLFRNNERNRNAFRKIPDWQRLMEAEDHLGIDESKFSKLFVRHKNHPIWLRKLWSLSSRYQRRVLFKEQYSTILAPIPWCDGRTDHPQNWFWREGRLTNDRDQREFMYLHFMNLKSNTWLPKAIRSEPSAWMKLDKLVHLSASEAERNGFSISSQGFHSISHIVNNP